MRIIPAIDIIDGKCVRLTRGDYATKKIYNANPLEVAKQFEASGIEYLHLVDLDGAKAKHIVNYKVLEIIATRTNLKVDFGGGLKTKEDLFLWVAFHQPDALSNGRLFFWHQWPRLYTDFQICLKAH